MKFLLNSVALGQYEVIAIVVLILILFGGAKIPQLMRGVGKGVGELQKGLEEGRKGFGSSDDDDTADGAKK